jgi:hypothetical protein
MRSHGVKNVFTIGCDNYSIDVACGARPFDNTANHRFPGNVQKRFSGQTSRSETSRNYDDGGSFKLFSGI